MMSRKPLVASTFWQPLRPFTGLVWALIAATILTTSFIIYSFNIVYRKIDFPYKSKFANFHDTVYHVINVCLK